VQGEHVDEFKVRIKDDGPNVTFDLHEVGLVDLETVRLLGVYEAEGAKSFIARRTYVTGSLSSKTGGTLMTFRYE
jgi:hypothetical protein